MHRKISLGSDKLGLSMLFFIFNMKFSNNKLFEKLLGKIWTQIIKGWYIWEQTTILLFKPKYVMRLFVDSCVLYVLQTWNCSVGWLSRVIQVCNTYKTQESIKYIMPYYGLSKNSYLYLAALFNNAILSKVISLKSPQIIPNLMNFFRIFLE